MVNTPPRMKMYQLRRFRRGKARSRAPIIMGTRKFPRTAGIDGTRKRKIMIMPWAVNSLLYVSDCTRSPGGVNNSRRISTAAAPPTKKNKVMEAR